MNPEKYFSVENGKEVMLGKLYDLKAAVDFAEKNTGGCHQSVNATAPLF